MKRRRHGWNPPPSFKQSFTCKQVSDLRFEVKMWSPTSYVSIVGPIGKTKQKIVNCGAVWGTFDPCKGVYPCALGAKGSPIVLHRLSSNTTPPSERQVLRRHRVCSSGDVPWRVLVFFSSYWFNFVVFKVKKRRDQGQIRTLDSGHREKVELLTSHFSGSTCPRKTRYLMKSS